MHPLFAFHYLFHPPTRVPVRPFFGLFFLAGWGRLLASCFRKRATPNASTFVVVVVHLLLPSCMADLLVASTSLPLPLPPPEWHRSSFFTFMNYSKGLNPYYFLPLFFVPSICSYIHIPLPTFIWANRSPPPSTPSRHYNLPLTTHSSRLSFIKCRVKNKSTLKTRNVFPSEWVDILSNTVCPISGSILKI